MKKNVLLVATGSFMALMSASLAAQEPPQEASQPATTSDSIAAPSPEAEPVRAPAPEATSPAPTGPRETAPTPSQDMPDKPHPERATMPKKPEKPR